MPFSRRSTGRTTISAFRAPAGLTRRLSSWRSRAALSLDAVFRFEETRTVSNDWVVRYAIGYLQFERQSHRPPARDTVQVLKIDGQIEIRSRDRLMRWTEVAAPLVTRVRAGAAAAIGPPSRHRAPAARQRPIIPGGADVDEHRAYPQLRKTVGPGSEYNRDSGCGSCRSRGREEHAPTAPWKPQNSFPQLPQALYSKGTFLLS